MAVTPPEKIGPYKVIGSLGSGGMGVVYRAIQEPLHRPVALKVVNPSSASDARFQERFLREAQAMARVHSSYVVTCYDAGLSDGHLYMALELVTGGDLAGLLDRKGGKLQEMTALRLMRDCLEGLEAIEAARLIHRDIKPANIFITDRGSAKLADLGLARSVNASGADQTMSGLIMGTPAYISPEQARGEEDLDIRADLYSLGATLFHLVAGSPPYQGSDALGTLVRVLNDPVPDLRDRCPEASPGLVVLVRRLLDKDKGHRPPSARAVREIVEELLRGRPKDGRSSVEERTPLATLALPESQALVPGTRVRTPFIEIPAEPVPVVPATTSRTPVTGGTEVRPVTPTPSMGFVRGGTQRIDPAQLQLLAKRIIVDQNGLRASVALAPGTSIPRGLLDQLLAASGVIHGLLEVNLNAAGHPAELPRRIILARGEPPTPSIAGRDVRGRVMPAVDVPAVILVADDGMMASVLFRPSNPPTRHQVALALAEAGVVHGIDQRTLARFEQPAEGPRPRLPAGGKLTIALGTTAQQPVDAGFRLLTVGEGDLGLSRVQPGTIVASWADAEDGVPGKDVRGLSIAVRAVHEVDPEQLVGAGVELSRTRDGDLCLRATREGVLQQQSDGLVRVVGVVEVAGDVVPGEPITTDDVVVVRGSVLAGAQLTSTSDVVILGDVSDAKISAGGDIDIHGSVSAGQDLEAGGTVTANDISDRRVLAGNVRITGTLHNCTIEATGDIDAETVIGGSVTAGGDIRIKIVGDSDGTPTQLWAGHHQALDRRVDQVRWDEKKREERRAEILAKGMQVAQEHDVVERRAGRFLGSQFMREDALREHQQRLEELARTRANLQKEAEHERQMLMRQRAQREHLERSGIDAGIAVGCVVYGGVTVRVGNRDPILVSDPRVRPTF